MEQYLRPWECQSLDPRSLEGSPGSPNAKRLVRPQVGIVCNYCNVLRSFFSAGTGQQLEIRVLNRRRPVELTEAVDIP